MKTPEEFKAGILQKHQQVIAARKKKRKTAAVLTLSLASCLVLGFIGSRFVPLFGQIETNGMESSFTTSAIDMDDTISDSKESYVEEVALGTVQRITVTTLPESKAWAFQSRKSIESLVNYFKTLHLTPVQEIEESNGLSYTIQFTYTDGSKKTIVHSGNQYLKINNGGWMLMEYREAAKLETLLKSLK